MSAIGLLDGFEGRGVGTTWFGLFLVDSPRVKDPLLLPILSLTTYFFSNDDPILDEDGLFAFKVCD